MIFFQLYTQNIKITMGIPEGFLKITHQNS